MSAEQSADGWVVYGRCPHGFKAELRFNEMGYVMRPHPDECKVHEAGQPGLHANVNGLPPPRLKLSERQIRREAKREARRAERDGWRPPWLSK